MSKLSVILVGIGFASMFVGICLLIAGYETVGDVFLFKGAAVVMITAIVNILTVGWEMACKK